MLYCQLGDNRSERRAGGLISVDGRIDMTDDVTDWRELREFKAVDLTKSFVLSWDTESGSLLIDVDLFLCPDHAFYEEPRPAEKACFRPAFLEFPNCSRIICSADTEITQSLPEIVATLGRGPIEGFRRIGEGRYEIRGEFGQVEIDAERPLLRLKGQLT
jgi:hypothetical protein